MTAPARGELPFGFGLSLGGYFVGLVLLPQLAFMLAPIPVAVNVIAGRPTRAKVYVLVAVLAGIMGMVIGARNPIVLCILYSTLGWPIAWAILSRITYRTLTISLIAFVFITQVVLTNLQWDETLQDLQPIQEFYQGQVNGSEASALSDVQRENLNTIIWTLEHWREVYLGFTFAGVLVGVCISVTWIYRILRRTSAEDPVGTFSDMRPHDATVWLAIIVALMGFAHSNWPAPWLLTTSLNAAIGLFALYLLNGFSILLYGLNAFKPNPILAMIFLITMVLLGGVLILSIVGIFDTWGEFRKRIDRRVQSVHDSQNHSDGTD